MSDQKSSSKEPGCERKLTLRQTFGLPVVGPDEQCRMHRQQSAISELTEQKALVYFVALERLASQYGSSRSNRSSSSSR